MSHDGVSLVGLHIIKEEHPTWYTSKAFSTIAATYALVVLICSAFMFVLLPPVKMKYTKLLLSLSKSTIANDILRLFYFKTVGLHQKYQDMAIQDIFWCQHYNSHNSSLILDDM